MTNEMKQLTLAIQAIKDGIVAVSADEYMPYVEKTKKIEIAQVLLRSCQTRLHYECLLELTDMEKAS